MTSSRNPYKIRYAAGDEPFRVIELTDPVPLGRQILEAAGVRDVARWSLFAIVASGDFEDVRLNEPFDLREKGAERFIGFDADELFKFTLNDRQIQWGAASIRGETLYRLADPGEGEAVFLDVRGGTDRLVDRHETVALGASGIERFVTAAKPERGRFEVTVIYNGVPHALKVRPSDPVAEVLAAARQAFGVQGGDIILVTEAGQELDPTATLAQSGVAAGARLIMRARVVQGG